MASSSSSSSFLLSSSLYLILSSLVNSLTITVVNNCPFTIWPAIQPNAGNPVLESGGFELPTLAYRSFPAPAQTWSGRLWARTDCTHANGCFSCVAGDCLNRLECNGGGGAGADYLAYGVSLVDGFNLPMTETPHDGGGACPVVGCRVDLRATCPPDLQVRCPPGSRQVVGCKSGCGAGRTTRITCVAEMTIIAPRSGRVVASRITSSKLAPPLLLICP